MTEKELALTMVKDAGTSWAQGAQGHGLDSPKPVGICAAWCPSGSSSKQLKSKVQHAQSDFPRSLSSPCPFLHLVRAPSLIRRLRLLPKRGQSIDSTGVVLCDHRAVLLPNFALGEDCHERQPKSLEGRRCAADCPMPCTAAPMPLRVACDKVKSRAAFCVCAAPNTTVNGTSIEEEVEVVVLLVCYVVMCVTAFTVAALLPRWPRLWRPLYGSFRSLMNCCYLCVPPQLPQFPLFLHPQSSKTPRGRFECVLGVCVLCRDLESAAQGTPAAQGIKGLFGNKSAAEDTPAVNIGILADCAFNYTLDVFLGKYGGDIAFEKDDSGETYNAFKRRGAKEYHADKIDPDSDAFDPTVSYTALYEQERQRRLWRLNKTREENDGKDKDKGKVQLDSKTLQQYAEGLQTAINATEAMTRTKDVMLKAARVPFKHVKDGAAHDVYQGAKEERDIELLANTCV